MKITAVDAYVLRLPTVTAACDGSQDTCLVRIESDAGITGWGEIDSAPTVSKAVIDAPMSHAICRGLGEALIGMDPLAIDVCARQLDQAANYYGRAAVGLHAMAGINIALWDIAGKHFDSPVYRLLGGPHQTRYRAYCSLLFGDTPGATYELARRHADQGFTAIKFGWGPMGQDEANDIALVREARRGAGDDVDILIDAGQVWNWKTALKRARQFAEFAPFWLEEPLHPDDVDGYARLSAESPIPIAAGEAEARYEDFVTLIDQGKLDWIQPDPARCGISTMVAVGRFARRRRCGMVNHTFKGGISIAASLHALSAIPGAGLFEYCMSDSPLRHRLTRERFALEDGFVRVPEGPGLGVTVDEDAFAEFLVD